MKAAAQAKLNDTLALGEHVREVTLDLHGLHPAYDEHKQQLHLGFPMVDAPMFTEAFIAGLVKQVGDREADSILDEAGERITERLVARFLAERFVRRG